MVDLDFSDVLSMRKQQKQFGNLFAISPVMDPAISLC